MGPEILALIWKNKQLIAEVLGGVLVAFVAWWFFWHNPKVIKELEADKAELARQVEVGKQALSLLHDIQFGKESSYDAVSKKIHEINQAAIPRRTVLIKSGVLPDLPTKADPSPIGTGPVNGTGGK